MNPTTKAILYAIAVIIIISMALIAIIPVDNNHHGMWHVSTFHTKQITTEITWLKDYRQRPIPKFNQYEIPSYLFVRRERPLSRLNKYSRLYIILTEGTSRNFEKHKPSSIYIGKKTITIATKDKQTYIIPIHKIVKDTIWTTTGESL